MALPFPDSLPDSPAEPPAAGVPASLVSLEALRTAVWLFDIGRCRMLWANRSALDLWGAPDLRSFLDRDVGAEMSPGVRVRLDSYRETFARGGTVEESWTLYPGGKPMVVECVCSGMEIEGGVAMLVEGRPAVRDQLSADDRRAVEALRNCPAMVSLYGEDGGVLMRNPAARLALDGVDPEQDNRFAACFEEPSLADSLRRVLDECRADVAVVPTRTVDGPRWHEIALQLIADPVTGATSLLTVQHDVTERIRLERELAQSEERLKLALEASDDGLWDWNMTSGAVYFSPRWQAMLGFEPGELAPALSTWKDRVHPDDLETVTKAIRAHVDGLTPSYSCEHRVQAKDGSWKWILDRGRVVARDPEGRPLRMVGTHTDVTDRKRADEELAESRMRLDAVLSNAPVGVLLVDPDRHILSANAAIARTFHLPMDRLVGASTRILYGDDAAFEEVGQRAYRALCDNGSFDEEIPMRRSDGADIWCRIVGRRLHPDDPARGCIWVIEDVTVRRRAEQALNDRASFQRVLLDTVPVPIFVQDVLGHYVDANTAFERWMGIDRQSLFGKTVFDLAPPELADSYQEADCALLADRQSQTYETQMRCADGSVRDVVFSKAVYCRTGGKPAGIVGAVTDISERKHAEQALRERQQFFEQIFVASRAVKLLIDPDSGLLVDANPAAAQFYGYPLDRLRTMRIDEINVLPPDEIAAEIEAARQARRQHFLFRHRIASGEIRDVEVYSSRVQFNGCLLLLSLVHDITERSRAEEALQRKTKELERSNAELEAFAYVASHDLRQPLRVVSNYLSLLERSLAGQLDEETREFIGFARDGAQRMDRLIVDLLEYSRVGRRAKPFRPVPLAGAVDSALFNLEMAVADAGAAVAVETALPTVAGDENELVRLFQNLIGNAVKYRFPDRTPAVRIACAEVAEGWRIDIADNGIGIAPEHRDRVFGIFQRLHRRDEYEGTGVGLAVCKKIVEHHGGSIWVEEADGGGCLFRLILPRLAEGTASEGGQP